MSKVCVNRYYFFRNRMIKVKKKLTAIILCALLTLFSAACSQAPAAGQEESGIETNSAGAAATISSLESLRHISDESSGTNGQSSLTSQESNADTSSENENGQESRTENEHSEESHEVSIPESSEIDLYYIGLSDSELELYVGQTCRLETHLEPSDATRTDYKWNWNNNSVITVESDGSIIAKSAGTATITAETYNGLTASCEVTVIERDYEISDDISEMSDSENDDDENSETSHEYKPAPEITGTRVDTDWFDNAVFVGDSISVGLCNYADDGALGNAEFLAKECMGFHSAMWDIDYEYAIHPIYNGVEVRIEDAIKEIGKDKIFILLGMNDICSWGADETLDAMKDFTDMILDKNPNVTIYIQSVTPMVGGKTREDYLNNENIEKYNELAKQVCEERGFVYLDIASVLSDEYGNLRADYCSDINGAGFHFNRAGDDAWVEYLKTHVE